MASISLSTASQRTRGAQLFGGGRRQLYKTFPWRIPSWITFFKQRLETALCSAQAFQDTVSILVCLGTIDDANGLRPSSYIRPGAGTPWGRPALRGALPLAAGPRYWVGLH